MAEKNKTSKYKTELKAKGYCIRVLENTETEQDNCIVSDFISDLTVFPKTCSLFASVNKTNLSFCLYSEYKGKEVGGDDSWYLLPRAYGIEKFGLPSNSDAKCKDSEIINLTFNGTLRENQNIPVERFLQAARDPFRKGGIINVPPGFGKTVMALYITHILKRKTLIVTHKEFLSDQWRERIEMYLPEARIGIIKQKKVQVENKDIVLASLQSVAQREYDENLFSSFGFTIIDECHHLGAEVFNRALPKLLKPDMIICGLSATLDRADGLRRVFEYYIGKPVYQYSEPEKKKSDKPSLSVQVHKVPVESTRHKKEIFMQNGEINIARMINNLCECKERNMYITNCIVECFNKDPLKRFILVLSERRKQLTELKTMLDLKLRDSDKTGLYIGGMSQKTLSDVAQNKSVILGTYQLISEGFDVDKLNTLIMASPVSSNPGVMSQVFGRILRKKHENIDPLVVDFDDEYSIFKNRYKRRLRFYKNQKFALL